MSDIDIVFNVDPDGKPRLEIEIEGHTDGGGGDIFEIPIITIECILKYNILYNNYNIYREA